METIHVKKLLKGDYSLCKIIDYFRANIRYRAYYSLWMKPFLVPEHIVEQIDFRIHVMMDKKCYLDGQCKLCGCTTPALQMTNASCKGYCYPKMVNKKQWNLFKNAGQLECDDRLWKNKLSVTTFCPEDKEYITVEYVG